MYNAALVGERHVRAYEDVVSDCLSEDFDAENISDYLFGFSLEVGMYQSDVVVRYYDVSES